MSSKRKSSGKDMDDVLSLHSGSSNEFSGFSSLSESENVNSPSRTSVRSIVKDISKNKNKNPTTGSKSLVSGKKSKKTASNSGKTKNDSNNNLIDLNNLTPDGISQLKSVLGLSGRQSPKESANPRSESENEDLHRHDVDDHDHYGDSTFLSPDFREPSSSGQNTSFSKEKLIDTLFGSDNSDNEVESNDDQWSQPQLKAPDLGEPIASSLAKLINTACSNQCKVNDIIEKYKVPSNCEFMTAPRVNEEIWGELARNRRVQSSDKLLRDIQNLVTAGMLPILNLAKILKPYTSKNSEIKGLIGDSLTLLGQVQFNMSIRRRYMLRPYLKSKYANICSINTPVTSWLFGDDIGKEIKKCETIVKVGRNSYKASMNKVSTSSFGPIRGTKGRGYYGRSRPYGRPSMNQCKSYGQFGHQHNIPKKKSQSSATATSGSPN